MAEKAHYGYHAVMGADGLFRSEPIAPGTALTGADGKVYIYEGENWVQWIPPSHLHSMQPSTSVTFSPHQTSDPDPESVRRWLEDGVVGLKPKCPKCFGSGTTFKLHSGAVVTEMCDCKKAELVEEKPPRFHFKGF